MASTGSTTHLVSRTEQRPVGRGLTGWQVQRVTTYMREHLGRELSLSELAFVANLSRFHFCTAFRLATGRTPFEWLAAERMTRARALLAQSGLRIHAVATAVGYQTPSAFAASFRRAVGVSPSEYRRSMSACA
jgi:AraC family transcriptional regulator